MTRQSSTFTNIEEPTRQTRKLHSRRWNPVRKCLLVMVVLTLVAAVSLAIALIVTETEDKDSDDEITGTPPSEQFCITKECILGAGQVIEGMNAKIDPCEDFYQFACGGWIEKHSIPADAGRIGTFTKLRRDLLQQLRGLLEESIRNHDIEAVKKTKRLYKSCLDEDKIEKAGITPLLNLLKELGGWPLLDKTWDVTKFNLVDLLIKLRLYNNDLLMSWGVSTDERHPHKHIIYFDEESLGMPTREHYLKGRDDPTLTAYEDIAINAAIMLGADEKIARKDIKDVIDFEIEIANRSATIEEWHESKKHYNKMTIEHLQNVALPDFPFKWLDLLQPYFAHANITVNSTTEVIVHRMSYLQRLPALLKSTNSRIICNYLITRFVRHRINNLRSKFRHLSDEYDKKISGVLSTPARWKDCVSYVNDGILMGDVTGRMFVQKYFDQDAKVEVKALVAHLRGAFHKMIAKAAWMDSKTRKHAEEKLAAIDERIGFADKLLNDTSLDKSKEMWDFKDDDYFGNVLQALRHHAISNMKFLNKDVDNSVWTSIPGVINAFYSPSRNAITFPAGILQPPFYMKKRPSSMNFGGIGAIIGHEMTHGFDNSGRRYDKDGDLKQWWTNSSLETFINHTECLVDQYSKFVENGDHVRGKRTLGENIADNGGMKIAYQAYLEHVAENGEEKPIAGVNLTHHQLVFVSFAQSFCDKATPHYMHALITKDAHPPEKFRITGTLSNNKDFSEQFKCKPGSRMNPVNKCSVW